MAEAVVLERWEGTDVRLGTVVDNLFALGRRAARSATRTSVMTLVVVANDDEEADRAQQATRPLGGHHPARLIVLRPEPRRSDTGVDARATVCCATVGDHPVSFDEVGLVVRGEAAGHLKSMIEPFTLPDLPIVLWYPGALPAPAEPLLAIAETVLVDSKEAGDDRVFSALAELSHGRAVVDLSWERLRPQRLLLAALFDGSAYRPYAHRVTGIEVSGKSGPRHLLGGWLMSCLGIPRSRVHLSDSRHIQVVIHAGAEGRRATFELSRGAGERIVQAGVVVENGARHTEVMALPDGSLAWSLAQALTHLGRDEVWERALAGAVILAGAKL
jgi:glucose-6-phosphate dehydrogenase assembly protein OpcA